MLSMSFGKRPFDKLLKFTRPNSHIHAGQVQVRVWDRWTHAATPHPGRIVYKPDKNMFA